MSETPPALRPAPHNIQSYFRSPYAPRIHFDEAGAGGGGGAGAAGAGGAGTGAGAGGGAKPWFDGLDAETLGHWDNKGWKYQEDPKSLASELTKAWKAAEKHIGAPADQILRLPKDASDEAGWNAVRQRLGMPKEAKEYDFSAVKRANGNDVDPALAESLRSTLHKAGTPKDAAADVLKAVVKHMDDADAAKSAERAAKLQADRTALQQEWGSNAEFNRLTAMQGAKRAMGGNDEAATNIINAMQEAIGYKATMEFWRKIGSGTTDDTFIESGQGGNPVTMNGAKARIAELEGDREWTARYLKGGVKEVAEMNALLALASGAAA